MKTIQIVLMLFVGLSSFSQNNSKQKPPKIKVEFKTIAVMKLHPTIADSIVEVWETPNSCKYWVDQKNKTICYEERDVKNNTLKEWQYLILEMREDDKTYTIVAEASTGSIDIVIWKDKTMVSLVGFDAIILIGEIAKE